MIPQRTENEANMDHETSKARIAEYADLCRKAVAAGSKVPPMPTTKGPNGALVDNGLNHNLLTTIWEECLHEAGHWLRRLPEVSNPGIRRAQEIEEVKVSIARHKAEVERLEAQLSKLEEEAIGWAALHWTITEIGHAKEGRS